MNPYSRLIPRLNGKEIEKRFDYYLGLAKKGVAGFIIFGGEIKTIREGIKRLQTASPRPLFIASDLEQGLGQQIEGGTLFPPAMAIASALRSLDSEVEAYRDTPLLLRDTFTAIALEARYAGINTVLAPVLDINTNPNNPIIATRAFGEDAETVSYFGCEMVKILRGNGIITCGKHFPGHGDTEIDSHLSLPVIKKDLATLEKQEIVPFQNAIGEGIGMLMLGHLSVPAIDPSGKPASVSDKIISYLRSKLNFRGLIITDAMNMGALAGYEENEASLLALKAGVDLILHPTDPDNLAAFLSGKNYETRQNPPSPLPTGQAGPFTKGGNILAPPIKKGDRGGFSMDLSYEEIDFLQHKKLSEQLAETAITIEANGEMKIKNPYVFILEDDTAARCHYFIDEMRNRFPNIKYRVISEGAEFEGLSIPQDRDIIVAVYSSIKAWKRKSGWLLDALQNLVGKGGILISFGNPYVLRNIENVTKIYAYWDSESAQRAVAKRLISA